MHYWGAQVGKTADNGPGWEEGIYRKATLRKSVCWLETTNNGTEPSRKSGNGFLGNLGAEHCSSHIYPSDEEAPTGSATLNIITMERIVVLNQCLQTGGRSGHPSLCVFALKYVSVLKKRSLKIKLTTELTTASYILTIHLTITPLPLASPPDFVSFALRLNSPSELMVSLLHSYLPDNWVKWYETSFKMNYNYLSSFLYKLQGSPEPSKGNEHWQSPKGRKNA